MEDKTARSKRTRLFRKRGIKSDPVPINRMFKSNSCIIYLCKGFKGADHFIKSLTAV